MTKPGYHIETRRLLFGKNYSSEEEEGDVAGADSFDEAKTKRKKATNPRKGD